MSNPNFLSANPSGIELMPGVNDMAVGYDVNRIVQALNGTNILPITTGDLTVIGNESVSGNLSITGGSAPAVPTGLTAIGTIKGVALYWNEITPGTVSPKQYEIQASLDPNFGITLVASETSNVVVAAGINNPNPWVVTAGPRNNLFFPYWKDNTAIYFRIRARDWAGHVSAWSASVNASTNVIGQSLVPFTGTDLGVLAINSDSTLNNFNALDFTNTAQVPPIARIAAKNTGSGSELHLGTSNNYASGITNDALKIDPSGNVTIPGGLTVTGGATITGATIATSLTVNPPGILGTQTQYRARFFLGSTQTFNGSGYQKVSLDTLTYDPANSVDLLNHRYVCPVTGYYFVSAASSIGSGNTSRFIANIFKNGGVWAQGTDNGVDASGFWESLAVDILQCSAGDVIELWVYQNGGSPSLNPAGGSNCWLTVEYRGT